MHSSVDILNSRVAARSALEAAHDRPTHRTFAAQSLSRRRALDGDRRLGLVGDAARAYRCPSRFKRQPGDCFYRLVGAKSSGSRRPGHLSADRQSARVAGRQGGALFLSVRLFHDLRDLRGQRGPLLRAHPGSRTIESRHQATSVWGCSHARAGRNRRRACFLVHRRGRWTQLARSPIPAGLVRSLSAEFRARCCGGSQHRRHGAAISNRY